MSTSYIQDGMLQPSALMNRELAGKCKIDCGPLSLPSTTNKGNTGKATTDFPFDYYSAKTQVTYPDNNKDNAYYLPGVIIYNAPRSIGNTTRYPFGFSRGFVGYFEPALKKAYDGVIFADRRYAQTPDNVWAECRIYNRDDNNKSGGLEVEASSIKNGNKKSFKFKDLQEAFDRTKSVAIRANITCSITIQAQVTKGKGLEPNSEAKPIIIPSKVNIIGPINIPEPVVTTGRKTVTSETDNADESFMDMLSKMNEDDEDEDEEEEEEDEDQED